MITVTAKEKYSDILTDEALEFLGSLVAMFGPLRDDLLASRSDIASHRRMTGTNLDYPFTTADIRSSDWQVADIPDDLL